MSTKADNRHLYLKVIERIKEDIQNGIYTEKEKLPSEFELSKSMGVSRATLREALRILEEEHVIIRRHGVGTFVHTKPLFLSGIEQLNSVTKMIQQANMVPGTIFCRLRSSRRLMKISLDSGLSLSRSFLFGTRENGKRHSGRLLFRYDSDAHSAEFFLS